MHPELLLLELHSKPALLFLIAEKDPAGRTLQKVSTPNCRPQDKFIFIRAFYNLSFLGLHPKPALLFSLQKRPCGPHLAGRLQKASPLGTYKTYFEPGVL